VTTNGVNQLPPNQQKEICAKYMMILKYVLITYIPCIVIFVLLDQTGNITVKVEAVPSAQDKGRVQTNRGRNPLSG